MLPRVHLIRAGTLADVEALTRLGDELGYVSSVAAMRERLRQVRASEGDAVFVAEVEQCVHAFCHVALRPSLLDQRSAELLALVVTEVSRSRGLGGALVRAAEDWGRSRGCRVLMVRSNVIRARAHELYRRLGYDRQKSQHVFRKTL
jgi:GNAT superfamily N-acetyltransferase